MRAWIDRLREVRGGDGRGVLVTVVRALGSTPREPGVKMVVTESGTLGTIGGGKLEYRLIAAAREMLGGKAARIEEFPLGPALGQCCGGHATVLLEPLPGGRGLWWPALDAARDVDGAAVLVTAVRPGAASRKMLVSGDEAAGTLGDRALDAAATERARALLAEDAAAPMMERTGEHLVVIYDPVPPDDFHIVLFGAGHVGRALIHVVSGLPCRIVWVDGRENEFPPHPPANVAVRLSRAPEDEVAALPAGAFWLVMTHSHDLDFTLCERILARDDFRYLGLIGSKTKRRRFEQRLVAKGLPATALDRLTCPIGVPGIHGKQPHEIAVAVAAEILQVRSRPAEAATATEEEAWAQATS